MKCFYCGKEIGNERYVITALDKPYLNMYNHRECSPYVTEEYLKGNIEKLMKYYRETTKKGWQK